MEKKLKVSKKKELNIKDVTTCDATAQMLEKAKRDGVETAFRMPVTLCPPKPFW